MSALAQLESERRKLLDKFSEAKDPISVKKPTKKLA